MQQQQYRLRETAALVFASTLPLAMALLYFIVLDKPGGEPNRALQASYFLGKLVQFAFPAVYVWCVDRAQLGFVWPTRRGFALAVAFGLAVGAAMFGLYFGVLQSLAVFQTDTPERVHERVVQFQIDSPLAFGLMAAFLCVPHSLSEEYYWRWFVFGRLRRLVPMSVAVLISALGFMAHHVVILGVYFPGYFWTLALPFSLGVAVGGAFWAWLYRRSGSLYAPWLSHALVDAAIMGLGFVMMQRYWA